MHYQKTRPDRSPVDFALDPPTDFQSAKTWQYKNPGSVSIDKAERFPNLNLRVSLEKQKLVNSTRKDSRKSSEYSNLQSIMSQ